MTPTYSHIGLTCKNPHEVEVFYTKHFGFQRTRVVHIDESEQIVFLKSGSVYLELFRSKAQSPLPPPHGDGYAWPGLRHLAFAVENVDEKLTDMGSDARVTLGPLSFDAWIPGWRSVWIADPEGNIVEVSQGYRDDPAIQSA